MAKGASTGRAARGVRKPCGRKRVGPRGNGWRRIGLPWTEAHGQKCKAMEGLVDEGAKSFDADGEEFYPDMALISARARSRAYEISAYGSLRAGPNSWANRAVEWASRPLDGSLPADEKLTQIALNNYPPQAAKKREHEAEEERQRRAMDRAKFKVQEQVNVDMVLDQRAFMFGGPMRIAWISERCGRASTSLLATKTISGHCESENFDRGNEGNGK